MAGHNKWSKIKRKKAVTDGNKAASLAKASKKIMVAVKTGGGADPDHNFKLKAAIDAAKTEGVPRNNIERAIEKAAGNSEEANLKEVVYEGYLPGGVAAMVITATDNTNRTYADVRTIFNKANGSLGNSGCVAYIFDRQGEELVPNHTVDVEAEEDLANITKALDALDDNEDVIDVILNLADN